MQKSQIHPEIAEEFFNSAVNAKDKGQSQFFTPLPFGRAVAQALPSIRPIICDLNCGAGHLLQGAVQRSEDRGQSSRSSPSILLGCDIDPCRARQKSAVSSQQSAKSAVSGQKSEVSSDLCPLISDLSPHLPINRITHDLTLLYPLLHEVDWRCDLFVLNPPFRLFWHKERLAALAESPLRSIRLAYGATESNTPNHTIDSTIATLMIALDRCTLVGEGLLIGNHRTLDRLLFAEGAPYAALAEHIWSRLIIPGNPMTGRQDCAHQEDQQFETGVIYFARSHTSGQQSEVSRQQSEVSLSSDPSDLCPLISVLCPPEQSEVSGQQSEVSLSSDLCPLISVLCPPDRSHRQGPELRGQWNAHGDTLKLWSAVKEEVRVRNQKSEIRNQHWNLWLQGGVIHTHLSQFQEHSTRIDKAAAKKLHQLKGRTPVQCVLQRQERDDLLAVAERGGWNVQPELRQAIAAAIQAYHAARAPLYPLNDMQRLGYLDEQDTIQCKLDLVQNAEGSGQRSAVRSQPSAVSSQKSAVSRSSDLCPLISDLCLFRAGQRSSDLCPLISDLCLFRAGQRYPLRTQTVLVTRRKEKPNSITGELEDIETTGQELAILIGSKAVKTVAPLNREPKDSQCSERFNDSTIHDSTPSREYCFMDGALMTDRRTTIPDVREGVEALKREPLKRGPNSDRFHASTRSAIDFGLETLVRHFLIPEVPDIAAVNPAAYQANLQTLQDLETALAELAQTKRRGLRQND